MASSFPIEIAGGAKGYPQVRYYPVTAGQTFIAGALVYETSDAISECGADPTAILGIALCGAADKALFPNSEIPVAVLDADTYVRVSSSTTPGIAHVGLEYGAVKSTYWKLDTSDTTNKRFMVVDYSPHSGNAGQEYFVCRMKPEFLQASPIDS